MKEAGLSKLVEITFLLPFDSISKFFFVGCLRSTLYGPEYGLVNGGLASTRFLSTCVQVSRSL